MRHFLQTLGEALSAGSCQALVIGGFSLEAYGFQRATHDIDLLVGTDNVEAIQNLLKFLGYQEIGRNEICARFAHTDTMLFPVDLLFISNATWDKMWSAHESAIIEGIPLGVPAPAHTIALKLHAMSNDPKGRQNDFADIIRILTHRPDALGPDELKSLCSRYAPEGVYERILTALRHDS